MIFFYLSKNMCKSSRFHVSLIEISYWKIFEKYITSKILVFSTNVCSLGVQQKTKCIEFKNSQVFKKSKKMRKNKFIFIIRKLFPNIISINFSWARLVVGQCNQLKLCLVSSTVNLYYYRKTTRLIMF